MELFNHFWLLLAYAGMFLHTLVKIEEERKAGRLTTPKDWFKENILSLIISALSIPLLILCMNDPLISTYLPINNVTSILVGWQTQSIFKSVMAVAGSKLPKE